MRKHWALVLFLVTLAATLIAEIGAQAQSVTRNGEVTVVRGNDIPGDRQQLRSSRGEGGVVVVRGNRQDSPPVSQAPQRTSDVRAQVGGRNIWFIDPVRNRVIGCDLQRDVYGKRYVDCASGGY